MTRAVAGRRGAYHRLPGHYQRIIEFRFHFMAAILYHFPAGKNDLLINTASYGILARLMEIDI